MPLNKYEFLRIQHRLNSLYANRHQDTDKALNRVNADITHLIHLHESKKLKILEYIDETKLFREDLPPYEEDIISLYDDFIYELELIAFSNES